MLSSPISETVMLTSLASDRGAMQLGSGSVGAGITVLALHGCRTDMGRSIDSSLTAVLEEPFAGLSALILSQTRFLVDGRETLLGSLEDSSHESRSSSCLIRTGHVTPPSSMGMARMTVVPLPADTEMLLTVLTSSSA